MKCLLKKTMLYEKICNQNLSLYPFVQAPLAYPPRKESFLKQKMSREKRETFKGIKQKNLIFKTKYTHWKLFSVL